MKKKHSKGWYSQLSKQKSRKGLPRPLDPVGPAPTKDEINEMERDEESKSRPSDRTGRAETLGPLDPVGPAPAEDEINEMEREEESKSRPFDRTGKRETLGPLNPVGPTVTEEVETMDTENSIINHLSSKNDVVGAINNHTNTPLKSVKRDCLDAEKTCAYNYASLLQAEHQFRFLDHPEENKNLYNFNGIFWECMSDTRLNSFIYKILSEEDKKRDSIDIFCKHVKEHLNLIVLKDYYAGINVFTEDDCHAIENHMVFRNCVYDVSSQKKLPHNSKYPYYMAVDAYYYDEWKETPVFDKLCIDATENDKESIDMIHYLAGYVMISNRSAKCFFVLADAKDSGKSVFGSFLDDSYCEGLIVKKIDPMHLGGRFSMGGTQNVVLLSCYEIPMEPLDNKAVALMKTITGETTIRTEQKFEKEVSTKIRFKMVLATNGGIILPHNVEDPAFMRRCKVIPFIHSTPEEELDNTLPQKLAAERDYIFSNIAKELHKLYDKNGNINFPESDLSKTIKDGWARQNNLVDAYLKHVLKYTADKEDAITKRDIYNLYNMFFDRHSSGIKNAVKLGSNELVSEIITRYPAIEDKKLRRDILTEPQVASESLEKKKRPCLTCLKIKESIELSRYVNDGNIMTETSVDSV